MIQVDSKPRADHALGKVPVECVHRCLLHQLEQAGRAENSDIASPMNNGGVGVFDDHVGSSGESEFNGHAETLGLEAPETQDMDSRSDDERVLKVGTFEGLN